MSPPEARLSDISVRCLPHSSSTGNWGEVLDTCLESSPSPGTPLHSSDKRSTA